MKDLEGKVAELEQKSYGVSVENENLRAILKRLQEENVKLKQSAFTFSMPINGQRASQSPPEALQQRPSVPGPKPPTPQSMPSDDALRSVHDIAQPQTRTSQSSSTSPVSQAVSSETSAPSSVQPQLFDQDAFNAFIANAPKDGYKSMSTDGSSVSPPSTTEEKKNEFDTIYRCYGASNYGWRTDIDPSVAPPNSTQQPNLPANAYTTYFGELPSTSGAVQRPNPFTSLATAYREHTQQYDAQMEAQTKEDAATKSPTQPDWSGINNASVDAFLANLAGANSSGDDKLPVAGDDDYFQNEFDAQLQQILQASATSPSNAFPPMGAGSDVNPFSPSKYLNMSPSPYDHSNSDSQSQSQSPESLSKTDSASGTPASSAPSSGDLYGSGVDTLGKVPETIHLMDDGGNVMTPHQIIDKYGMHAQIEKGQIDALVIDDLCDAMKAKATCKDGAYFVALFA